MKKLFSTFFAILFVILCILPSNAQSYTDCYLSAASYLFENAQNKGIGTGSIGGEWLAISLALSGRMTDELCKSYKNTAFGYINEKINDDNRLSRSVSSDNSRMILALTAIGVDPTAVCGHNLVAGLADINYVKKQGINGLCWALIALDSHNYETAPDATASREAIIDLILSKQLSDGGWNLTAKASDPDVTAMVLTSLSRYTDNTEASAAVNKAICYLSAIQNDDGSYSSYGNSNSQSCAQVIVALCSLGINPTSDSRFIKNRKSVVDALCSFFVGSGFGNTDSKEINQMSTEQAVYALAALEAFDNTPYCVFDFSSVEFKSENLRGDADLDGVVSVSDARITLRIAIGLEKAEKGSVLYNLADMNADGYVTVSDARLVLRKAIGLSDE